MRRILCSIMALIMILSVNSVFAGNNDIRTKNLSKELDKKLDFSMELSEATNKKQIAIQGGENSDIISDNKLNNTKLEIEINNQSSLSELTGILKINNRDFILQGEGKVDTYDVLGEEDYMFGEYFGYIYKNNKPVREFGMTVEYAIAEKEYIVSSLTLMPTGKNGDKGSAINFNFGLANKEMNNKFFEKYKLNTEDEKKSMKNNQKYENTENNIIRTSASGPVELTAKPKVSSPYGDLMYMACSNTKTFRYGDNLPMYLRLWTNNTNMSKFLANKYGYPVRPGTTKAILATLEINNTSYLRNHDLKPLPAETNTKLLLPYFIGTSLKIASIPFVVKKITVTSATDYKSKWKIEENAGMKNTDATSSTPWTSPDATGLGVSAIVGFSGIPAAKATINTPIEWKGSIKFMAITDNLGIYTYVYYTQALTTKTYITLTEMPVVK